MHGSPAPTIPTAPTAPTIVRLAALALLTAMVAGCASTTTRDRPDLFVVRHAEAWMNVETPPIEGEIQDSLTPRGRRQAAWLARMIADSAPTGFDIVIFTSPLVRAVQTAEAIAAACEGAELYVIPGLRPLEPGDRMEDRVDPALARFDANDTVVYVSHGDITTGLLDRLDGPDGLATGQAWHRVGIPIEGTRTLTPPIE